MNTQARYPKKLRGFTLIELMIVVAIIGVLAAVAYPQYLKSMQKSHRADGQSALTNMGQALERCYTQNFKYTSCSGVTPTPSPATSNNSYYTLAASATTTTYTVTATAIGSQTKDTGCTSLTLSNTGSKSPTSCWSN